MTNQQNPQNPQNQNKQNKTNQIRPTGKKCKICNSIHRNEIEEMRLLQGQKYKPIIDYFIQNYNFKISNRQLSYHFQTCIAVKSTITATQQLQSEILREAIQNQKIKEIDILIDMLSKILADFEEIRVDGVKKLNKNGVQLYTSIQSSVPGYLAKIEKMRQDQSLATTDSTELIDKYEKIRKNYAEQLSKMSSFQKIEKGSDKESEKDSGENDE